MQQTVASQNMFDPRRPIALLGAIMIVGDLLLWDAHRGLSWVVFAWTIYGLISLARAQLSTGAVLILCAASLPMLEYVQLLSFAILVAGLWFAIAWQTARTGAGAAALVSRMVASIPTAAAQELWIKCRMHPKSTPQKLWEDAKSWAFPVGGAVLLIGLLSEANPILSLALQELPRTDVNWDQTAMRALFWISLALILWPLLTQSDARPLKRKTPSWANPLSQTAVLRSLLTFNLVLAIHISLDAVVLSGGALPEGVSHSEYARRGAFPLLAATMLGGGFALLARKHLDTHAWLRPLLYLWIAQNILLTIGAGVRLATYVEAFGLTYLRLHAGIWMAVIIPLLGLTALQVWRRLPERWLVIRGLGLCAGVLYIAAFVNFADVIARQNLARDGDVDMYYLRHVLPDTARATVQAALCPEPPCSGYYSDRLAIEDWREWGFRRWRVDRRMEALMTRTGGQP